MIRYANGLTHGILLCAMGLGFWIYGLSWVDKLKLQLWYLTASWPNWLHLPW